MKIQQAKQCKQNEVQLRISEIEKKKKKDSMIINEYNSSMESIMIKSQNEHYIK